jgi:hypothetical protein
VRYVPYGDLEGVPNVVVDGDAQRDTLLTLSHWPRSPTPVELRDDLSAQIAFHYLDHPELHVPADAVSNNHFDQDGLMSVYALVDPNGAQSRRERAIDVARAGDFGTFHDRDAARASWTIALLASEDPGADPYEILLPRVPELLDHPERFGDYWAAEDAHLDASEAAIHDGTIRIDEREDLDLAIVTVPEDWEPRTVHRFTTTPQQAVHPGAVHNATDRFRLVYLQGRRYEVHYRYETWVQYTSRRPPGRIDLDDLASELTALESGGTVWLFTGVSAIYPTLTSDPPESALPRERFLELVTSALARGEPSWDPYGP